MRAGGLARGLARVTSNHRGKKKKKKVLPLVCRRFAANPSPAPEEKHAARDDGLGGREGNGAGFDLRCQGATCLRVAVNQRAVCAVTSARLTTGEGGVAPSVLLNAALRYFRQYFHAGECTVELL